MTAKEYLQQLESLNIKINNKQKELDDLRLIAQSTGGFDYSAEKVQTSPTGDTLEKKVVKCVYLEQEINDEIDQYVNLKHKIINQIHALTNPAYIQLLFMRYVEFKKLEQISVELNYSYNRIRHLHGYALQVFNEKYLQDDTQ